MLKIKINKMIKNLNHFHYNIFVDIHIFYIFKIDILIHQYSIV